METQPLCQIQDRLVKLLGMLGSAHDGEVAAAGRAASEYLRQRGMQWADVINIKAPARYLPSSNWRSQAFFCRAHAHQLTSREHDFIVSVIGWRTPTAKQTEWLQAIYERLRGAP